MYIIGSQVTTFPDNPLAVVDGWTIRHLEIAEDNPKYEYYSHCLYDKTKPTAQEQFLGYMTIASTTKDVIRLKEDITRLCNTWNLKWAAGTLVCPSTLKSIDANAFNSEVGYGLRTIKFNDGLEEIGAEAFKGYYIVSDNNSHGISHTRCFLTRSFGFGRKNSVSCTIPYGVMQETLLLPSSDNELYNLHATKPSRHISCHR